MKGAFYCKPVQDFLTDNNAEIRDALTEGISKRFYQQLSTQTDSWFSFLEIVKNALSDNIKSDQWAILLEYPIPRRAKRIDAVIIAKNLIFVIEFKDGAKGYSSTDIMQVEDYCLDLRDFHFESNHKVIIPILLCSDAKDVNVDIAATNDSVKRTQFANPQTLNAIIRNCFQEWDNNDTVINYVSWNNSIYLPTPTIIEAAQSLFAGQDVKEISRSHAGTENLTTTTQVVLNAIAEAKINNSKIICFITGVPGAGKTLAGLNIVHNRDFKTSDEEIGVFLSGNSPLVKVLTEALSRDFSKREKINKKEANRRVTTFVHNVHQFIDEYYEDSSSIPKDKVLIYDEAQRAWTKEYKYRKSKKKINASEPEILLDIMNRVENSWSVIIALVGGGQEINTGEGGLCEWGKAIADKFTHWKVYISPELKISNTGNETLALFNKPPDPKIEIIEKPELHLNVSIRSYRAKEVSNWVDLVLSNKSQEAFRLLNSSLQTFQISITRSLERAKKILNEKSRGTRRSGLVASSGGRRLRATGIDVNSGLKGISTQNELGAWYLNSPNDVRSSNFLEVVGSEFGVQGLELDWIGVCWDLDLRRINDKWDFKSFEGTKWYQVRQPELKQYVLNKYRVLLTRAREGIIIYVPIGDEEDITRPPNLYNAIAQYIIECGVKEI